MEKLLLIYNPRAGRGEIRNGLSYILEELAKNDYQIEVHPTLRARDAVDYVSAHAARYDLIVCCGGDGTLDEVVTGLMNCGIQVPIGYIPAGSTNDFANSIGIPKQVRDAAAVIAEGQNCRLDVGKLNNAYFTYVAAFGAFTEVSYKTPQESKNMLGHAAYLIEGMKSLPALKSWKMSFESEEMCGDGDFFYGMITNSDSVGGFKGITGRNITLNDGVFEVTLIRNVENILEWPAVANALLTGEENNRVVVFKTSKITFHCEDEVPWTTDGEFGGSYRDVTVENLHYAMTLRLGTEHHQLLDAEA